MVGVNRCVMLGVAAVACIAGAAMGQDKPKQPEGTPPAKTPDKMPGMSADEKAMMEAWEASAKLGPMHKWLSQFAGNWETETVTYSEKGATPPEKGRMEYRLSMGGRFVNMDFEGKFMSEPYHGAGMVGYNNVDQRFESTWVDTMGTGILFMTGQLDKEEKVLKLEGEMTDALSKKKSVFKETLTVIDKDHHKNEFFDQANGKEVKIMEITYTRATKPTHPAKMMEKGEKPAEKAKDPAGGK